MKRTANIKILVTAILALSFVVSCSKVERVLDSLQSEIKMEGVLTKASSELYPEGGIFGIYAYYVDAPSGSNRVTNWNTVSAAPYLENVAFKYDGTVAVGWNTSTDSSSPYYWPVSGSMVFAGYSPHIQRSSSTISSVTYVDNLSMGRPENPHIVIGFKQNTVPAEMVDLMFFSTMSTTVDKTDSPFAIEFSHAVSKVSISFKDPNGYYRIRNARLKNCIDKGNFYVSVESPGWNPDLESLSDYQIHTDLTQLSSSPVNCTSVLPMPQYLDGYYPTLGTGTGKGVSIAFELVDKTNANFYTELEYKLYPYENGEGVKVNESLPARWIRGMHYSYVFTIEADPIEFDNPSVTVMAYETETSDAI